MPEPKPKARVYRGEQIDVSYDLKLCMHAAECVTSGLHRVFDKNRRPWVDPDGASPERIIDVVERCPSGALTYQRHDPPEMPETNSVRPQPNSALYVRGDVTLQDHDGAVIAEEPRLALCRCGRSQNKPYCDYSHAAAGFDDDGQLGNSALATDPIDTEEKLTITAHKDGPLVLRGAFALRSADHAHIRYGDRIALCRCGHSGNKPFCDNSHKRSGFRTDPA